MSRKIAFFAFNGQPLCFMHVLLNAIDLHTKHHTVKVVIEGAATCLVDEFSIPDKPFANLFAKARKLGVIDCVCKACASKTGSLTAVEREGLRLCDELLGHPAMSRYIDDGYEIVMY
ncbi:MAG: cytoplasmic protein [Candidatus Auribacter fodinae]|jgi:hypothetical protein|uniref:Cytoplasmic protein n=1 Tax=Candidatus Auribacter fodinae TaxID=2093366 RepID=A0A3A4R177_9BACT|nr:MAG: cytoplasmic protein [Candidatus Auribacter fodinae]